MNTITAQIIAEIKALGWRCFAFGPEVWLMIAQIAIGLAIFNAGILLGMYIAALMRANGREDDERH